MRCNLTNQSNRLTMIMAYPQYSTTPRNDGSHWQLTSTNHFRSFIQVGMNPFHGAHNGGKFRQRLNLPQGYSTYCSLQPDDCISSTCKQWHLYCWTLGAISSPNLSHLINLLLWLLLKMVLYILFGLTIMRWFWKLLERIICLQGKYFWLHCARIRHAVGRAR
jgi:hypothetical protein